MAKERLEIEIVLDDGSIAKGFAKLEKKGKNTAKKLDNSFSDFGSKIGAQLKAAAIAYLSFRIIKKVIKDLADLGQAIAEIKTIVSDATTINEDFVNSLVDISSEYGVSAQNQAKSYYQIISAGVTDAVKANELLIASNELAIGGLTSTAASIDILTSVVNSYGQKAISAGRASDILFGTVKLGKTTTEQLASSLGQVLPVANAVGVSFEEVSAAIATLTLRGLSTSEAVTQLNAVFTAVLKKQELAIEMGPRVAKAFSQQALETKGLTLFLKDLSVAVGGSSERLVKLLGRVEGAKAIIALGADNFKKLGDSVDELKNSAGAAAAAYEIMTNTINHQSGRLGVIVDNIGIRIASPFKQLFIDLLKGVNSALLSLLKAFILASVEMKSHGKIILAIGKGMFLGLETLGHGFNAAMSKLFLAMGETILQPLKILIGDTLYNKMLDKIRTFSESAAEVFAKSSEKTKEALDFNKIFTEAYKGNAEEIKQKNKELEDSFNALGDTTEKGLDPKRFDEGAKKIVGSLSLITKGLVQGKSGLGAFVAVIADTFGDALITAGIAAVGFGKVVDAIKASVAKFEGTGAVAAGLAAIALGGALKGLAAAASGSDGASGSASSEPEVEEADIETKGPQPVFNLTIQGDVLDRRESGLAIKQILEDFAFEQGGITVS